jgi:hypothetical protein
MRAVAWMVRRLPVNIAEGTDEDVTPRSGGRFNRSVIWKFTVA